jgi:oxepin-CoA hydrolase/3-oxo-5,6-dehydrosuberyl-CoA semialdehyde dehydrogenase
VEVFDAEPVDYENGKTDEEATALVAVATILTMVEKKQTTFVEITDDSLDQCLSKLTEESTPAWGAMTAQQMVEHLEYTYRIASGEIQDFEIATPEKVLEKVAATLWDYNKMPKEYNFPLYEAGIQPALKHENLAFAKAALLKARQEYLDFYKKSPKATTKNVVFGTLNKYEWYLMERKHLNHHFEQFGLL